MFIADQGSPLIYARRGYGAATRIETPASVAAGKELRESGLGGWGGVVTPLGRSCCPIWSAG